jgi:hypothetical protein
MRRLAIPDRSSRPQTRHFGPALVLLASLGIAEAAPPAGSPVFIHVQGLAPTTVGLNGFIVAGDFTEDGAFQWMPTSGVTLVGGGLWTGYISRDGTDDLVSLRPKTTGHSRRSEAVGRSAR